MLRTEPYRLSFTAASSMLKTFVRLAVLLTENSYDIDQLSNSQLEKEKESTKVRQFRELKHRLRTLTPKEIDLLAHGSLEDKKHMTLLAICKTYRFVFDFVVEVIRDKALLFDLEIRDSDYKRFITNKAIGHPEVEELTESSQTKIKTVLFRTLAELGLISDAKSRVIQPMLISQEVQAAILSDNPEYLKIFLKSDKEIAELTHDN
ncbi:MAG TPA: DUF1819 family protein [Flavisolibacter sp.]|jgi:hypothetical protein|nr:DUF1819 family protein [Flavisolibacter sp.]